MFVASQPSVIPDPVGDVSGFSLGSDKELNLVSLPACNSFYSPCLLAKRVSFLGCATADLTANSVYEYTWYWRVDLNFGAWVLRTLHAAGQSKADQYRRENKTVDVQDYIKPFLYLRMYLCSKFPDCWSEVERLAKNPVILPGAETMAHAAMQAKYGLCPAWKGWERHLPSEAEPMTGHDAIAQTVSTPSPTSKKVAKIPVGQSTRPVLF